MRYEWMRTGSGIILAIFFVAMGGGAEGASPGAPTLPAGERPVFERPQAPVTTPNIQGPRLLLSLREAVGLALARNFDITIEAFNPRIRENDVTREKSVFDPAVVSEFTTSKSILDTASGQFTTSGQNTASEREFNAGIEQKVITGAEYSLLFQHVRDSSNSRFRIFDPSIETRLTFSISQPLLKNFGIDVNKAQIRVASANRDQSLQDYRTRIIEVVDSVEQAYWDLVFAISTLDFRKKSLDLAKDLLRRNRIRVEVGALAPIEILEAEATVASRGEQVIVAERQVKDQEDALKLILNITDDIPSWSLLLVPKDKPAFSPVRLDEMNTTLKALRKRADLERARIEIDKQKTLLKRARQNLLPELNLKGSAASDALDNNTTNSLNRLSGAKGYILSGGVSFRIPIGNRQARAEVDSARLQTHQALARYNKLEQSIIEEVRRSVRRVRSEEKRIEATRVARRLAEERLAAQEKKFSVGLSTSRDILEDQESLANALTNETQALVDYNKSLAQLDRVTHSTPDRYRIQLPDPRMPPAKGGK